MSTILAKIFSILLLLVSVPFSGASEMSWNFRSGGGTVENWLEQWDQDTEAAQESGALTVLDPPGNVTGDHTALVLNDVLDSSIDRLNDAEGTPTISLDFGPVRAGSLSFRAGTSGTQNQNAKITLFARNRPLMIIKITNNSEGLLVSRQGEIPFSDPENWFNRAREYKISWNDAGAVNFRFTRASGEVLANDVPLQFLAPGKPDQITMEVGYGRGVNKALRIESFSLTTSE